MSITDQDQLSEVQLRVLEPDTAGASWPSGLWSQAEVLDYFNQRQSRFNKETGLLLAIATVPAVANQVRYTDGMPTDWIATQRVIYFDNNTVATPMKIVDQKVMDALPASRMPTIPTWFDESTPPLLSFDVAPAAPDSLGAYELLYISLLETLGGSGDIFDVPDDFVPYVTYGVLADMFAKIGRVQNLELAAYFESRWDEGVNLARYLLEGRY